jgi:hypothetical protein
MNTRTQSTETDELNHKCHSIYYITSLHVLLNLATITHVKSIGCSGLYYLWNSETQFTILLAHARYIHLCNEHNILIYTRIHTHRCMHTQCTCVHACMTMNENTRIALVCTLSQTHTFIHNVLVCTHNSHTRAQCSNAHTYTFRQCLISYTQ